MDLHTHIATTAVKRYGALQKPWELSQLLGHVAELKPRIIVEIGVDAGGTLYCWNRLAPDVLGIDLPGGPFGTGRQVQNHGATLIIGNSHDYPTFRAAQGWVHGSGPELVGLADFLLIDGDHSYQGCMQDWNWYRELVRPGGAIAFHDIRDHERPDVGVDLAWLEVKDDYKHVEIIADDDEKWAGIGVLWLPEDADLSAPRSEPVEEDGIA